MWTLSKAFASLHCSPEPAAESSAEYYEVGAQSAPSKSKPIAEPSSAQDRTTEALRRSRFGTTFGLLTGDRGAELLTLFLAGFPAKISAQQGRELESKEVEADSGKKCTGLLAKYDRATHLWKTPQCSLLAGLDVFSEIWPKSGMMRNGRAYPRATAELRTNVKESGFWLGTPTATMKPRSSRFAIGRIPNPAEFAVMFPTPRANKTSGENAETWLARHADGKVATPPLALAVKMIPTPTVCGNYNRKGLSPTSGDGLATWAAKFPTPQSRDFRSGSPEKMEDPARQKNLNDFVAKFPTPRSSDATACQHLAPSRINHPEFAKLSDPGKMQLRESVQLGGGNGGSLNPDWVEWLMGWPIGWTDLKPLETGRFQSWRQGLSDC